MSTNYNKIVITKLVERYRKEVGDGEISREEIAAWAIQNQLWKPTMKSQIALLCDELSTALRSERKEFKGRKVRQYHCVRRILEDGAVQTVWAHIDVATPEFMELSVARRRQGLAAKAYQLHNDIVYWNEFKNPARPLEMLFDFRDDIADRDQSLGEEGGPEDLFDED